MPLTKPLRIPFAWPYSPRSASTSRDPQRINVINEQMGGETKVLKRPGMTFSSALGAGTAQGLTYYNDALYAVINDNFVSVAANPNSGTTGATFTQSAVPPWAGRYRAGACVFKDRMWIMAGCTLGNAGVTSDQYSADVWSSTDGVTWVASAGSAPWGGRHGFSAVVLGNKMYIAGGYNPANGTYLNDVWSTENGTEWVEVTDVNGAAWDPRGGMGFVASASGLYVIGGIGPSFQYDDVWYSADGAIWKRIGGAFGWGNRYVFGCLYFQNKLWIIGGYTTGYENDVWMSADGGITWTQTTAAAFGSARFDPAYCVYNNKMWIIGGANANNLDDVYSSPDGITWTLVTAGPGFTARSGANALVFRTPTTVSTHRYPSIWVLGGSTVGTTLVNEVWRGDLDTAVGASTALNPTTTLQRYQFNSFQTGTRLLIKNQSNMWVYDSGGITGVTDAGYPTTTVPGIVVLGGFAYVMDPSGLIYSCALDNPYYWPALNVLGADYEDDAGVCLVKYLNYVVAFGTYTTQVFYDAGLATGSPLRPYLNANMKVGCANANTVCQVGTTVVWVGQSQQGFRQVLMFNGVVPQPISSPAIDKLLTGNVTGVSSMRAFCITANGHLFYVLVGVLNANRALVYDFSTKEWFEWDTNAGVYDYFSAADLSSLATYLLHPSNGNVYYTGLEQYDDDGTPFSVILQTGTYDADTRRNKFWGRLDIVGDVNASTPSIYHSDDDGQSYSTPRIVDMNTPRPALFRNGASRYRLFVYLQEDSSPMRLEALEQQFEIGS